MKASDYLQKASAIFDENRTLKFVIVILAIMVCFNSLMTYRAVRYERTIILPSKISGPIEYIQGKPNERYIRDTSRTLANLFGTYTPSTVRENFEQLLFYYAPESYPQASTNWYALASKVEESLVTSSFYPERITFDEKKIELTGQLIQYTSKVPLEDMIQTYLIDYRIQDGRFYVVSIKEKIKKAADSEN